MLIALDYDGTYTKSPALWNDFIVKFMMEGHTVICITMRFPEEAIEMPCEVFYTSRKSKASFIIEKNMKIDIWVDDSPYYILHDAV